MLSENNLHNAKQFIRLPGQQYDEETELYYNRHRNYDPQQGRYITQDPIGGTANAWLHTSIRTLPLIMHRQTPLHHYRDRIRHITSARTTTSVTKSMRFFPQALAARTIRSRPADWICRSSVSWLSAMNLFLPAVVAYSSC